MIALQCGQSQALLQPETGTVLSFRAKDREWLWCEDPDNYSKSRSLGGIPLLFPWANRLQSFHVLTEAGLHEIPQNLRDAIWTDGYGLPLHGTMLKRSWQAVYEKDQATLQFEPTERDLRIFPIEHRLQLSVRLRESALEVGLLIENGARPLPLAAGFHPYFRLDALCNSTDELRLAMPLASHMETDRHLLPTGKLTDAEEFWPEMADGRRWRELDDGFLLKEESEHLLAVRGARGSLRLRWGRDFPVTVLFAPHPEFICIEPMTAPTNAWMRPVLPLRWLAPHERCELSFAIEVETTL